MAFFDEEFSNHEAHAALQRAASEIDQVTAEPWTDPEGNALEYVELARHVVDHARLMLNAQSPSLTTAEMLDPVKESAERLASSMATFRTDRSLSNAQATHSFARDLSSAVARLPMRPEASTEQALSEARAVLVQAAATTSTTISAREAEVAARFQEMDERLSARVTESVRAVSEAEATLSVATDTLLTKQREFEAETLRFQNQHAEALRLIDDRLGGLESEFKGAESTRQQTADKRLTDLEAELRDYRTSMDQIASQAKEVLALAGGAALSGRWVKQAQADRWERYGWIAAIAVVFLGSLVLAWWHVDDFTAPAGASFVDAMIFYIPRLPLAIITITVLGFMISQAARRAQWEARDTRVGNELTSFPAFLSHLSGADGERAKIAADIAHRYFPGTQVEHDAPKSPPEDHRERVLGLPASLVSSLIGNGVLALALAYALTR